jgi:hypothetical protein
VADLGGPWWGCASRRIQLTLKLTVLWFQPLILKRDDFFGFKVFALKFNNLYRYTLELSFLSWRNTPSLVPSTQSPLPSASSPAVYQVRAIDVPLCSTLARDWGLRRWAPSLWRVATAEAEIVTSDFLGVGYALTIMHGITVMIAVAVFLTLSLVLMACAPFCVIFVAFLPQSSLYVWENIYGSAFMEKTMEFCFGTGSEGSGITGIPQNYWAAATTGGHMYANVMVSGE